MELIKKTQNLDADWVNWNWQNKNSIRDLTSLRDFSERLGGDYLKEIESNIKTRKLSITPYFLQLIIKTLSCSDISEHPLWRQVIPFWDESNLESYDGETENWELDHEMKTPICQHKYDNRVIVRISNSCISYCQFCFEALRTLEIKTEKSSVSKDSLKETISYIKKNKSIEEVILSGGDPLILSDKVIEKVLSEIRAVNENILIRIHSRSLTFNPFRITNELVEIFKRYKVNSFGVHICHPLEISSDFKLAISKLQGAVPIVFSNMPFLKGVNDNEKILHELFIELYRIGVKPYYLYHFMPFSPGANEYKVSVDKAIDIMDKLKRKISNIAMPEYVLPHSKGKYTVPLIKKTSDQPYFKNVNGKRYYNFLNWEGEWCQWES